MKRSDVNHYLREAAALLETQKFYLPPWASWSVADWAQCQADYDEVRQCGLGWDITDFGSGDFEKVGLLLFTIRNGLPDSRTFTKKYAEKIMIVRDGQQTPLHFHWYKTEDIINRSDRVLKIQVWKATAQEELSEQPFTVRMDGFAREVAAGTTLALKAGESITMEPYTYHCFYAEGGTAVVGEVSMVNDDKHDNRFYKPAGRFPAIEEDEPILYPLCTEYDRLFPAAKPSNHHLHR